MTKDAMTGEDSIPNFDSGQTPLRSLRHWPLVIGHWSLVIKASLALLTGTAFASEPAPGAGSAIARFAQLPLSFEANQGQADERVQFIARGHDHTVYLGPEGATIAVQQPLASTNNLRPDRLKSSAESITRLIRMTLPGAKPNPVANGVEPSRSRVNYLLGNDPARWQQAVPTFAKVQYSEVYPGVDLVYYGNNQQLEYDFIVAPGADPAGITLHFAGADRLEIDGHGDLVLHLGAEQLRQHRPIAYQTIAGQRREVTSRYRLKDARTVTFALGDYDRSHTLVIDPVLSYSTYFGGKKREIGWAIAVDASGNTNRVYISGDTLSTLTKLNKDFVKTNSGTDAFVARLDQDGTNLTVGYLTYLGGRGLESALGIAVDGAGAAYLTGYTTSTNFPTFGPSSVLQPNIGGTNIAKFNTHFTDAFVTKLDATGGGVYSTYLGGEFGESGADIAVDAAGSAYVVGYTDSMFVYVTTNRVETTVCTNMICGATVIGTNVQYVTLPESFTTTNTVTNTTSKATNVIVTTVVTTVLQSLNHDNLASLPTGFPVVNGVQTNNAGFVNVLDPKLYGADLNNFTADLFVSKVSADGSALEFSTYHGGIGEDYGTGIAVDPDGNTIVSGYTRSSNFPLTNAFECCLGGVQDAVVAKFDPSGALVYSTFLGGTGRDTGYRVAVDAAGFAYVAGAAGSSDFPRTPGARNRGGVFQNVAAATNDWSLSSSGLTHSTVSALVIDPFNPGTLYAGTPRGVFKTTDGGAMWVGRSAGLVNRGVSALAFNLGDGTIYAGTPSGVFTSTDGALNWTNSSAGSSPSSVRAFLFEPGSANTIYAGSAGGVFKTTNGVATYWFASNTGLKNRSVYGLAASAPSVSTIYAATEGGVYKSTNAGANWKAFNTGLKAKRTRAIVIDPANPDTLYVGTTAGLYKSVNAATNWTLLTVFTNPPFQPSVSALILDPSDASTLFAGTSFGLFKSADGGSSWALTRTNQTLSDVSTLTYSAFATDLYAGTRGISFAGGTNDAFLVKLAPDGLSLAYAFTLGGSRNDEAWDVAVDAAGFATLVGQTASGDFPIAGFNTNTPAYQTKLSGRIDAFVSKFDPTGATNIFTMYFGGKGNDFGHSVALDSIGDTYIVGRTESSKLPTTNGLDTVKDAPVKFGGGKDAFVAKLATGSLPLLVTPAGDHVIVSWPAPSPEYILESRDLLDDEWTRVSQEPTLVKGRNTVVLPAATAGRFFRLRTP